MKQDVLCQLQAPFAPAQIKQREGQAGQWLDYVETPTVIARLNQALAGDWSFEIVEYQLREELSEVTVLGRLSTGSLCKMQFGSAELRRQRCSGELLCVGDDVKAAASDALKKCATLLGVGLHLYRSEERPAPNAPPAAPGAAEPPPPAPERCPAAGRLSARQQRLILQLAGEAGLEPEALAGRCRREFGAELEALSKSAASRLIDGLLAARTRAA